MVLLAGCGEAGLFISGVPEALACDDSDPCTVNNRRFGEECVGDFVCPIFEASTLPGLNQLPDGEALSIADFDGDGRPDVAVGRAPTDTSAILQAQPTGFTPQFLTERHQGVLWTDLDNDSDLDLVASGAAPPAPLVYYRNGQDGFERLMTLGSRALAPCSVVFDQNKDGWNDVLAFETVTESPSLN